MSTEEKATINPETNLTPNKGRNPSPKKGGHSSPTHHDNNAATAAYMTPQEITERLMEQKLYESPLKWISASKRIDGENDIAEKKAELAVKMDRDLLRDWTNFDRERNDYLQLVKKKLTSFKVALDGIRTKLTEKPHFYEKPAHEGIEQMLEGFESKIAAFKLNMKSEFDQLEASEETLLRDIYRVDQMITTIQQEEASSGIAGMMLSPEREAADRVRSQQQQQRLEEDMEHKAAVGEIDRQLAVLGRFAGWDPRDHDAFIRVWNGYFGSLEIVHEGEGEEWVVSISTTQLQNLLKKLEFNVFGKTLDELKEHIDWYSQVLKLTAKKKKLITDWKKQQTIRKKFATQEAAASEQIMLAISKSRSGDSQESIKNKEMEEKRLNAKLRIQKWKNDKQRELELQKLEEEEKAAMEQKKLQEERKRRQMEVQVKLEEWKTTKAKEALQAQTTERKSEPKHVDEETLRKRAEKDFELAKERKLRAEQLAAKKKERERRMSEIPGSKFNVESKLHSSTKASEAGRIREEDLDAAEHRRHSTGAHGSAVAMNARDLQFTGRATPLWMKSLK